jgi:response regulator RpfG family c-di-GMP phosphodiesterase
MTDRQSDDLTILVVDDEVANLELYRRALRSYTLHLAESGEQGLVLLAEHRIDIIVTDQRMPGISGAALLERARAVNPRIRRIIVSAYAEPELLLEAINRGQADRYLVKPIAPDRLRQEVDALAREYRQAASKNERVAELEEQLAELRQRERQRLERRLGDRRLADRRKLGSDSAAAQAQPAGTKGVFDLEREIARAVRYKRPASILMVQDRPGLMGVLAPSLREFDLLGLIDGEIVLLLPETDRKQAEAAMQRLAQVSGESGFRAATMPDDGTVLSALMAVAR